MASNGTLLDYIQTQGKPVYEPLKKQLFSQLMHAVRYLHKDLGLIHHDIKLENILLDHDLGLKLCDFGLAETIQDADHPGNCYGICCSVTKETSHLSIPRKQTSITAGSLHYLAPEQLQGKHYRKGYCDIWASGCCLYAMDTAGLPFNDSFLPRLQMYIMTCKFNKEVLSKDILPAIDGMLVADVEKRFKVDQVLELDYCLSMEELANMGYK